MSDFANHSVTVSPGVAAEGWAFTPPRAVATPTAPRIAARYDAARTNRENARHWANADGLSARAANSPQVRAFLRNRARYECNQNNSYGWGIVETLANDVVGTGPRLRLIGDDRKALRRVEVAFERWTAAVGLAEKLRTMRRARAVDGEAFALLVTNEALADPVKLDLRLVEADQVATPGFNPVDDRAVDGIRFDAAGNPVEYHLLRSHPGDSFGIGSTRDFAAIAARSMIHWFKVTRPGQVRGVPDITPAITKFAELRRYTDAVIAAAETAADFAAVLYTDAPPGIDEPASPSAAAAQGTEPFDAVEIDRRVMTTLPAGWKMGQFEAQQPQTTYEMFKREIITEIARCLNMPYNIAAGNSSSYNYSSGRLDHQTYYKSIGIDQYHLETAVLDRLFRAWLEEARLATDLIPARLAAAGWPHGWIWDGWEHVDPLKEAEAQATRLANGTTTPRMEWARQGLDGEEKLREFADDMRLARELGLPLAWAAPPAAATNDRPQSRGSTDERPDEE